MPSGTLFSKTRNPYKTRAKFIKAGIYASKNLCYHLDERHILTEDGYRKATDTAAWETRIKGFVEYRLDLLTKEVEIGRASCRERVSV